MTLLVARVWKHINNMQEKEVSAFASLMVSLLAIVLYYKKNIYFSIQKPLCLLDSYLLFEIGFPILVGTAYFFVKNKYKPLFLKIILANYVLIGIFNGILFYHLDYNPYWYTFSLIYVFLFGFIIYDKKWIKAFLLSSFMAIYMPFIFLKAHPIFTIFDLLTIGLSTFTIYYIFIIQTINRQHKLEEIKTLLTEKQQETDNVIDHLNTMVMYKNMKNEIVKVNKRFADIRGKDKEYYMNKSLYELEPQERAKAFHEEDLAIIKSGKPVMNDIIYTKLDNGKMSYLLINKIPLYDANNQPKGIVIQAEDITTFKEQEEKLKASEHVFRMLFEKSLLPMFIVEHPSRKIVKVNKSMCSLVQYSENELLNMTSIEISHEKDAYMTDKIIESYEVYEQKSMSIIKRYIRKDGEELTCEIAVIVILDPQGNITHRIGILNDLTEKIKSDEKIRIHHQKLKEINQNMQEMMYIISHDLREPLRTITSYIQLLEKKINITPENKLFLNFIVEATTRMNLQIKSLVDYSQYAYQELHFQKVDIADVLHIVEKNLLALINETQTSLKYALPLPKVYGDPTLITQLFQNLISNAIKYTDKNKTPLVEIKWEENLLEQNYCFEVKDNGIGIEEAYLEQIFGLFRRLHKPSEYEGTGIGLTICRKIIQRHNETIWAKSKIGIGSSFYFTLASYHQD